MLLNHSASLLHAIDRLNAMSGTSMTLFVVDDNNVVLGTLTDGDIRRALLASTPLDAPALDAANKNFKAIKGEINADSVSLLIQFREKGITLVPRIDDKGRVLEIIDLNVTHTRLPVSAILMAGGKGERLRPLTLNCPKPLLQIEGKAIIDYNIEALAAAGITDITVATRYLAEQIEDHFSKPVAGVSVKCIREESPLGTIGAASLIPHRPGASTLVMNSDLITSISFEEFFLKHHSTNADITIAVIPYQVAVPFAILALDGNRVTGLEEKPSFSYYANAGIYLFKNSVLNSLAPGEHSDATDLIERTINSGGLVSYYPIKGTWIDVGSPTDFKQASELIRHFRNFSSAQQSSI